MKPIRTLSAALLLSCLPLPALAAPKFTADDYKRALWMTTRFYGGQRMGHGPNWLLMDHPDKKSFIKDAADGRDLSGGWADCGDYPLFGQTFFYSAYVLAKAYDAFPTGFPDMYHGFDYSDYARTGNWDQQGGTPDGIPDLLQELKYATDWIIKATPDAKTFYYQKGQGGTGTYGQHSFWVTSGFYSKNQPVAKGGESDGSRPVLKLGKTSGFSGEEVKNDGSMPSFAAATLAVMARAYRKFDAAYADTCLQHARFAFEFARQQNGTANTGFGGFYPANDHMGDDIVIAATELYKTTSDEQYKSFAMTNKDRPKSNHGWGFNYSTNDDVALFNLGKDIGLADKTGLLKQNYVDRYSSSATGEGGLGTIGDGSWGFLRYPANQAFIAALYSSTQKTSSYDPFIHNQIDFILGSNNAKQSFIVGFCSGCSKSPRLPHHRNAYLDDNNDMLKIDSIPKRNQQLGFMVGFKNLSSSEYKESMTDYKASEGGLDYQAGLVGALGYIVSKLAPVDTSKFGGSTSVSSRSTRVSTLRAATSANGALFTSPDATTLEVLTSAGQRVWNTRFENGSASWSDAAAPGLYLAVARDAQGRSSVARFVRD